MKIFVTGATGVIGWRVVPKLAESNIAPHLAPWRHATGAGSFSSPSRHAEGLALLLGLAHLFLSLGCLYKVMTYSIAQ